MTVKNATDMVYIETIHEDTLPYKMKKRKIMNMTCIEQHKDLNKVLILKNIY